MADVRALVALAKSRQPGLPVYLLGHSAGGVVSSVYCLEHQADLAGFICESFAFQVAAPDIALAVVKGAQPRRAARPRPAAEERGVPAISAVTRGLAEPARRLGGRHPRPGFPCRC